MNISGNTVLITGGTSGIGLGLAKAFLKNNNTVLICGRRKERLDQIKQDHPKIITQVADLLKDDERTALFKWVEEEHPEINMLVNNAGIQLDVDLTEPIDLERLRSETEINFYAPVHLSSLFANLLSKNKRAAIINISSGLAFTPMADRPIYCATKAALHSFSITLRYQLRDTSVRVFEIIPPQVDSELGAEFRSDPSGSHGGMPVSEFAGSALKILEEDRFEAAVGLSQKLYEQREELFTAINRG